MSSWPRVPTQKLSCVHHRSPTCKLSPFICLGYRDSSGWGIWSSPEGRSLNAGESWALSHYSGTRPLPRCCCHFLQCCVQQVPSFYTGGN